MKLNIYRGDLADISARKEALSEGTHFFAPSDSITGDSTDRGGAGYPIQI